jgi:hypothetical protein
MGMKGEQGPAGKIEVALLQRCLPYVGDLEVTGKLSVLGDVLFQTTSSPKFVSLASILEGFMKRIQQLETGLQTLLQLDDVEDLNNILSSLSSTKLNLSSYSTEVASDEKSTDLNDHPDNASRIDEDEVKHNIDDDDSYPGDVVDVNGDEINEHGHDNTSSTSSVELDLTTNVNVDLYNEYNDNNEEDKSGNETNEYNEYNEEDKSGNETNENNEDCEEEEDADDLVDDLVDDDTENENCEEEEDADDLADDDAEDEDYEEEEDADDLADDLVDDDAEDENYGNVSDVADIADDDAENSEEENADIADEEEEDVVEEVGEDVIEDEGKDCSECKLNEVNDEDCGILGLEGSEKDGERNKDGSEDMDVKGSEEGGDNLKMELDDKDDEESKKIIVEEVERFDDDA